MWAYHNQDGIWAVTRYGHIQATGRNESIANAIAECMQYFEDSRPRGEKLKLVVGGRLCRVHPRLQRLVDGIGSSRFRRATSTASFWNQTSPNRRRGEVGMTLIYRIQDGDGRGPYKPGWSHVWQEYRCLIDGNKKPTFMDEFPGIVDRIQLRFDTVGGHFGCGFHSMKQLRSWFTQEEVGNLQNHGYQIVIIDADDVLESSDNQLVFWCEKPLRKVAKKLGAA